MTSLEEGRQTRCAVEADVTSQGGLVAKPFMTLNKRNALKGQGDTAVTRAVFSLNNEHLVQIYNEKDVLDLLTPAKWPEFGTTAAEWAIEICRFVNRVCSENAEAITAEPSTISTTCDVLVLDRNGVRTA